MASYPSIRDALANIQDQQLDERCQELEEEQGNVAAACPAALANLNEQVSLLETVPGTWDKTKESLDHLYSWKQNLITNFNNVPESDQTKRALRDYHTKLNLFELHIGLETVILEDNNNCIQRQERAGININQHYNLLASRLIQISCQQRVLRILYNCTTGTY